MNAAAVSDSPAVRGPPHAGTARPGDGADLDQAARPARQLVERGGPRRRPEAAATLAAGTAPGPWPPNSSRCSAPPAVLPLGAQWATTWHCARVSAT